MFATRKLYDGLQKIEVIDTSDLSDHNPIVADFEI